MDGFDYDTAINVARATMSSNWRLVEKISYKMTHEELAFELAQDVWWDWARGKYKPEKFRGYDDPKKTRFWAWASRVVYFGLIDRTRSSESRMRNDAAVFDSFIKGKPLFADDPGEPAMIPIPRAINRGRIGHPPAAYMEALKYREKTGIGWRTLFHRLHGDPAMLTVMGFTRCPPLSCLRDARRRLTVWAKRQAV